MASNSLFAAGTRVFPALRTQSARCHSRSSLVITEPPSDASYGEPHAANQYRTFRLPILLIVSRRVPHQGLRFGRSRGRSCGETRELHRMHLVRIILSFEMSRGEGCAETTTVLSH